MTYNGELQWQWSSFGEIVSLIGLWIFDLKPAFENSGIDGETDIGPVLP